MIDNKGGFISAHWDGTIETENKIKELTKATIRCIPNEVIEEAGFCILSGKNQSEESYLQRPIKFLKILQNFKNVVYLHPQSEDYFL